MQLNNTSECLLLLVPQCLLQILFILCHTESISGTQCFVNCIIFQDVIMPCSTLKGGRTKPNGFEEIKIQPSSTLIRDLNHVMLHLVVSMLYLGIRFA